MKYTPQDKPPLIMAAPEETETATFALGCFWSPDALFGCAEGVVRTRVGYAGGTTEHPTYWTMADHIETVQLDYAPSITDYNKLLKLFFSSHKATRPSWKRQYMSAVFYHSTEQEQQARQAIEHIERTTGERVHTALYPYRKFYLAEDRHQKYKLQRQQALMKEFQVIYPSMADITNSTAAARVNGYLYGNSKQLLDEIHYFRLIPCRSGNTAPERQSLGERRVAVTKRTSPGTAPTIIFPDKYATRFKTNHSRYG